MMGQHCINTWSKTRALIAKSSAESELYGVVKASCEALGSLTLAQELGQEMKARVHVDAAAAKGIVERAGLDKVRHIDVDVLWVARTGSQRPSTTLEDRRNTQPS